jgi:mannose-6-phosphate isomerase-like protein (cupin superfamily)
MSSHNITPKVSTTSVLSQIHTVYTPKLVATLKNAIEFRVAKIQGDFVWHSHTTTDEFFLVLNGGPLVMNIRHVFDDPESEEMITLGKGELFVVPAGTQHMPGAEEMVEVLIVEKCGELNTGDLGVTSVI